MKKILWVIILILSIQICYSLGVGPAFNTLEYKPDTVQSGYLKVYNTEDKDLYVLLNVDGALKDYIVLDQTQVNVKPNEDFKRIYYHVEHPELEPGSYPTRIKIIETPPDVGGESVITAALGVSHKIALNVPAFGKYLRIDFSIQDKFLKITLDNIGEEKVDQADIVFTLTDEKQELVYEDSASNIAVGQTATVTRNLQKIQDGVYQAKLDITYDQVNKVIEKQVAIGQILVTINSMQIADFELGDIAKIDLEVENQWNRDLDNLNLEMEVVKNNRVHGSYRSEDFNLKAKSKKNISTYWDTQGKPLGDYDAHFTVNYAGQRTEKSFVLTLQEQGIITKAKKFNWILPISIIAVILLVVAILLLLRYIKQRKDPVVLH